MPGVKEKAVTVNDIGIRNYARYLLRERTIYEKREPLSCLRSGVVLDKKCLHYLAAYRLNT